MCGEYTKSGHHPFEKRNVVTIICNEIRTYSYEDGILPFFMTI